MTLARATPSGHAAPQNDNPTSAAQRAGEDLHPFATEHLLGIDATLTLRGKRDARSRSLWSPAGSIDWPSVDGEAAVRGLNAALLLIGRRTAGSPRQGQ
jgi:hypothetical protein